MQNYSGLIWLFIPLIFMILIALLFLKPRGDVASQKKVFYVIIVIGLIIIGSYYIIRLFIIPP